MKIIEVDDELYHYIASKTEKIGEPASAILRRLLGFDAIETVAESVADENPEEQVSAEPSLSAAIETPAAEAQVEETLVVEPAVVAEPSKPKTKEKKARKVPPRKLSAKEQQEAEEVAALTPSAMLSRLDLGDLEVQHGAVGRFLYLLSALEAEHKDSFTSVVKIKGRDRLYFASSEEALTQSGSSTNPKRIGKTNFWVITNNNTSRKQWMLKEVAKMLGYNDSDLRILAAKI